MTHRIGLLTGEYPPMEGGVGAFTQELAKALAALGHEITIFSHRDSKPAGRTYKARELNDPIDLGYATLIPRFRKWHGKDVSLLAELLERYEIELLNIQYQPAAFNMRRPNINLLPWRLRGLTKTVVTYHDLRVPYLFPKAGGLRQKAVDFMAQHADGVIATNRADLTQLEHKQHKRLLQIPIGSNITVHPVDEDAQQALRGSIGVEPDEMLLAYFGFLNESKGADTLIDALAQLPKSFKLVFIGGQTGASDPDNNASFLGTLKAQIAALGLEKRVHWTGFVADAEVSGWLSSAEITALPYRDGVSLRRGTLMAALAHGCPVITTPPDVPEDGLTEQNFVFAPPNDADALAKAIASLAADPARRKALGANSAELAQQFTWTKIAEQTARLYAELLTS